VLPLMSKLLNISLDLSRLGSATEETRKTLESFGLIRSYTQEKKKEEQQFRWFI
jgi:replication initiation and membrane attachment protein DnaB